MNIKTSLLKSPARSLFAAAALTVIVSFIATPTAQAVFLNYYRDYVSELLGADWNDANVAADVADCEGVVNSIVPSAYPWMNAPLTDIAEARAAGGYAESVYDDGYAYYDLYLYYAFSYPAYFDYYYELASYYRSLYGEIGNELRQIYNEQSSDAYAAFNAALIAAGGVSNGGDYPAYVLVELYETAWLVNGADYALQEGTYGYNLWASSAPYYALAQWYSGVAHYYASIANDLFWAVQNNYPAYMMPGGFVDQDAMYADAEAASEPYYEVASYWSTWEDYYRGLSDYYEG